MRHRPVVLGAVIAAILAMVSVATIPGSAASSRAPGRQSRTSGEAIAGGDVYLWSVHGTEDSGGGCTVSFAVRSTTTKRLGALTAGHALSTAEPPIGERHPGSGSWPSSGCHGSGAGWPTFNCSLGEITAYFPPVCRVLILLQSTVTSPDMSL